MTLPLVPAAIQKARDERLARLRRDTISISLAGTAAELIALLDKREGFIEHLSHIGYEMYVLSEALEQRDFADLFFCISEFECFIEMRGDHETECGLLKNQLKSIVHDARIIPDPTGDEKQVLEAKTLPILQKMVDDPQRSVELLLALVKVLDEEVRNGRLGRFAAASEIICTLDRPQIYSAKRLRPVVIAGYELDDPELEDDEVWGRFMKIVEAYTKAPSEK